MDFFLEEFCIIVLMVASGAEPLDPGWCSVTKHSKLLTAEEDVVDKLFLTPDKVKNTKKVILITGGAKGEATAHRGNSNIQKVMGFTGIANSRHVKEKWLPIK